MLLTPFGILFQDFSQGVPLALSLWLIATPVAYVGDSNRGFLATVNQFNPLSHLVDWPRSLVLPLESSAQLSCLAITGTTFLLALVAWILFRISIPHIIARIGS